MSFDPEAAWPVILLGLRDEAVDRPWDPPAAWWPERGPDVRGVRDREAGGAWLATNESPPRAAVVLNRHEDVREPEGGYESRGVLPLDAVTRDPARPTEPEAEAESEARAEPEAQAEPEARADAVAQADAVVLPATRAFNLVTAGLDAVTFTRWDGSSVETRALSAGVHMITHEGPDDAGVPRETRWLPEFREARRPAGSPGASAWDDWLAILQRSSALATDDPEALFRSDVIDGHHYASLSVSLLALGPDGPRLRHARLSEPGHLDGPLRWQ